ncbi:hypothetical protein S7711_03397 [Stachybotrys chartarum IBT 7711]|uniref:Peptidase S8/S53 domain-containing protein n=1 Tax=Stachybotrys chartarum (strain CBS 109288 / IBT 7711) TaxID=1280523 RepID=A0A084AXZ7_STACB|nr:hypothetical protein S7711_03397 [Stachybotrys chartarum IBT 7711]
MRVSVLLATLPLALAAPQKRAPLHIPRNVELVEDKYIVKLRVPSDGDVSATVDAAVSVIAADADQIFETFGGFAATLTKEEIETLRSSPNVEYIEQNAVIEAYATQTGAPWGLARLSNVAPGSTTYTYDDVAGAGTCVYIVDTGIEVSHPDFEGRATWVANLIDSDNTDGNGHGTHVAGTVGGATYGVAKETTLFGVKVLNAAGSGTTASVVGGMDFVVSDGPSRASQCPRGIAVNMSLGGSFSAAINAAAANVVSAGYFLAVAAGNGDKFGRPQDSASFSPASEPTVCTVGATDINDSVASFSNYGSLLDVYAPGVAVLSTWIGGTTRSISGTSMASPHIAGLGAYFMSLGAAGATTMCEYIRSQALSGVISGVRAGTANLLAQN